jgi:hypothetical protein
LARCSADHNAIQKCSSADPNAIQKLKPTLASTTQMQDLSMEAFDEKEKTGEKELGMVDF